MEKSLRSFHRIADPSLDSIPGCERLADSPSISINRGLRFPWLSSAVCPYLVGLPLSVMSQTS